jgi:hypothetical protein
MDLNRIPSTTHGHEFHNGLSRVVMVRKTEQRTFASGKNGEVRMIQYEALSDLVEQIKGPKCYEVGIYEGVSKSFRTASITKYTLTTINTR